VTHRELVRKQMAHDAATEKPGPSKHGD